MFKHITRDIVAEVVGLLEAIAADRLLVVCGAGLSMAAPSNLPSAAAVARTCSDAYVTRTGIPLDVTVQEDIAKMSRHFLECARFENFFIAELVPWAQLKGTPLPRKGSLDPLGCWASPPALQAFQAVDTLTVPASWHCSGPILGSGMKSLVG